jgi:hypothetical protein
VSAGQLNPQTGQQVAIARVLFSGNTATVVIRNIQEAIPGDAGLTVFEQLSAPGALCSGPANCQLLQDICVEAGDDRDLFPGEEAVCTINGTSAVQGELAVMSNEATVGGAFPFAYIAWDLAGGFTSPPPPAAEDGGVGTSLELRAVDRDGDPFWTLGQRISMSPGDNTIVGTGDTTAAAGFTSCGR